ncbi:MAG: hypothetical protein U0V54_14130 [Saprospiraceae bacterium]
MQDIYQQRNTWKFILAIVGTVILVITLFYSNYLARNLEENELKNAALLRRPLSFCSKTTTLMPMLACTILLSTTLPSL